MKPGDTTTGTVDIQNTGSISGTFSLSRVDLTDSDPGDPMSARIDLVVIDCGDFSKGDPTCEKADPEVYNGTLNAMSSAADLGSYAPDDAHRYEFTATLDSAAGNEFQGDSTSATFQWDAVQ